VENKGFALASGGVSNRQHAPTVGNVVEISRSAPRGQLETASSSAFNRKPDGARTEELGAFEASASLANSIAVLLSVRPDREGELAA